MAEEMTDRIENQLADYLRGELGPEERALVDEWLKLDPAARQMADDFRALLALAGQILQDDPPEELLIEARQAVLRSVEEQPSRLLRLMALQFQGSWGHGEICLRPEGSAEICSGSPRRGALARTGAIPERRDSIGQVPLLKLQVQGSWGHGEGCLPDVSGPAPL